MATNDVPGSKPANRDKLDVGCWAEHEDGSLILVQGFETDRVIYSIFDVSKSPMLEYRDAMFIGDFEKAFSTSREDIGKPVKVKGKDKPLHKDIWTWHDKTAFPWEKIMDLGEDGPRFVSAGAQLSAAARLAEDLVLRGERISGGPRTGARAARSIGARLKAAFDTLRN